MTACGPLCAPITGGAESLSLPADSGRIWGAVPPLWREGFPHPGLFTGDERTSRKNKLPHLPAVRRGTCGRHQQQVEEGDFTHPRVGASRAFGLPQAAAKRLFAGRSPHPLFLPCGAN